MHKDVQQTLLIAISFIVILYQNDKAEVIIYATAHHLFSWHIKKSII